MRYPIPFFLALFVCANIPSCFGQTPQPPATVAHWSLSFNAPGLLEPQAAAGLGVGYQWNDHWQLWLESSLLCQLIFNSTSPSFRSGFREILALKYYFGKERNFFWAVEGRFKKVVYSDKYTFYNRSSGAMLNNYPYTLKNSMPGGAIWAGLSQKLKRNPHFRLEASSGLGFKYRSTTQEGLPPGFGYYGKVEDNGFPFTTTPRGSGLTMYMPASIRIFYVF